MSPGSKLDDRLRAVLVDAVGPSHVLVGDDLVAGYVTDWTGRWTGTAAAVVRPGSTDEVRAVVSACAAAGVPLVPQGGNTGLVGGSVPHRGEILLSLRRLDRLEPVDERAREVTVGAGVTIGALQEHARRSGLEYGVDLASRDSATVGGTIATNAGGMHVVAHGDTRAQVRGLEVVFADGEVGSSLSGVARESTGPDPFELLVGSEGSLGVITAARLRLVPRIESETHVVLIGVDRLEDGLRYAVPGVGAVEFFDRACLEQVMSHQGLPDPLSEETRFCVLVESAVLPDVPDGVPAVVDPRLWTYRESITETISRIGVPTKLDVAVPSDRVDDFADAVRALDFDGSVFLFGHLAEANFHVNVVDPSDPDRVVDAVLEVVVGMGGAIASEHGIGIAKAAWWRRSADPVLVSAARRIKDALDPAGILNPEVFWRE